MSEGSPSLKLPSVWGLGSVGLMNAKNTSAVAARASFDPKKL